MWSHPPFRQHCLGLRRVLLHPIDLSGRPHFASDGSRAGPLREHVADGLKLPRAASNGTRAARRFRVFLAFQEEAAVYFGRDDDIRRLIKRLDARRAQGGAKLIALLGSSGSGKSSLLRAG